jgi:hypothetical protein
MASNVRVQIFDVYKTRHEMHVNIFVLVGFSDPYEETRFWHVTLSSVVVGRS